MQEDLLTPHIFASIEELQNLSTQWLWCCNTRRPDIANGHITPVQKRLLTQANSATMH
jgi:hypothetical protein